MEPTLYEEIESRRVQAWLVTSENKNEVAKWCGGQFWPGSGIELPVARGERMRSCPIGWYVVKSSAGDFSVIRPKEFKKKYQEVSVSKKIPLVHHQDGKRIVIGEAEIKSGGIIETKVTDALYAQEHLILDKIVGYSMSFGFHMDPEVSVVTKQENK